MDAKEYIEQLAQSAGLSQEEKDSILKVAANEKFSKALVADVLRQSDYSRNMDALAKKTKETTDYYSQLLQWKATEEPKLTAATEQLAAYESMYGPLNGNANGNQRSPVIQGVSQDDLKTMRKQWEEEQAKRDGQFIGLLKDVGRIASAHAVEFKETLDTDALEKVAMERNLPLKQAYDEFVRPRREEKSAEARKAEIAQAREEAVRDYAAKHHIPVDSGAKDYHPFFNPGDPKQQIEYTTKDGRLSPAAERQLRSNFVDEWNKAGQTSGT